MVLHHNSTNKAKTVLLVRFQQRVLSLEGLTQCRLPTNPTSTPRLSSCRRQHRAKFIEKNQKTLKILCNVLRLCCDLCMKGENMKRVRANVLKRDNLSLSWWAISALALVFRPPFLRVCVFYNILLDIKIFINKLKK